MWEEEMRIREELGEEVERGMEDEIKGGIYKLGLRLHCLYSRQNEQRKKQSGKKLCSELRIKIRMEGGTKIEFREIKREVADEPGAASSRSSDCFVRGKKFDWTQSLRSEDSRGNVNKKNKKKAFIC